MEVTKTSRGFSVIEFKDRYGVECTIQKSSLATEEAIWFGYKNNRMHLTQDQVKELLPILQRFVETGEIE